MFVRIPGLAEAIKRENDIRDAAFLDLTTDICGVEIRQMTPRDLLILDGIGNPIMTGGLPSPMQLAYFLWLLSPKFKLNAPVRRWLFWRRCRKLPYISVLAAVRKYIEDTFQDSPASSGISSTPYVGWCAHLVNNLAINYGWDDDRILDKSLKRLFQYLKTIRRYNNPEAPMHNPSDKVKGDYLRGLVAETQKLNARNSLLNVLKKRCSN